MEGANSLFNLTKFNFANKLTTNLIRIKMTTKWINSKGEREPWEAGRGYGGQTCQDCSLSQVSLSHHYDDHDNYDNHAHYDDYYHYDDHDHYKDHDHHHNYHDHDYGCFCFKGGRRRHSMWSLSMDIMMIMTMIMMILMMIMMIMHNHNHIWWYWWLKDALKERGGDIQCGHFPWLCLK